MKRLLSVFILVSAVTAAAFAQAPKWLEKSRKAVFSIVTYDADGNILNSGNGFFVGGNGTAVSDFSLFKGAAKAVIVTVDGKRMDVDAITGANEMYDVIKFRVNVTDKKQQSLTLAAAPAAEGDKVYLLPYSTQKDRPCTPGSVKSVSKIGDSHSYYTLSLPLIEKTVSCPVVNVNGEVIGIAQRNTGKDSTTVCYAAGASYAMAQEINAFSMSNNALRAIGIRKDLPDNEEQALLSLYMASSQLSNKEYMAMLDDFVAKYPNSVDGYLRRASVKAYNTDDVESLRQAAADYDKALSLSNKKDEVYFSLAKQIYSYRIDNPDGIYTDWTYDKALEYADKALSVDPLPVYTQLAGDILFAKRDYAGAYERYVSVNNSELASPATFFNAAKAKELMGGEPAEVVALMDSCVARIPQPYTADNATYFLERAQAKMNAAQYRSAVSDYDTFYNILNGAVNDLFYYYREQAEINAKMYQLALNDIAKAIELNPTDMTYQVEQAVVNLRVGRADEAQKQLQAVLKNAPDYAEGYRLLGICQIQLNQKAQACESFHKAKSLGDESADALISKHCN
jgi:predicted negative regulator of RcsB-dependent stress response